MWEWVEEADFEDWLAFGRRGVEITTELNLKQDFWRVREEIRTIRREGIQEIQPELSQTDAQNKHKNA